MTFFQVPNYIEYNIQRKKFEKVKKKESSIIFRLAYHDIYLLYQRLKNEKIKKINYRETSNNLHIKIFGQKNRYNFNYDLERVLKMVDDDRMDILDTLIRVTIEEEKLSLMSALLFMRNWE